MVHNEDVFVEKNVRVLLDFLKGDSLEAELVRIKFADKAVERLAGFLSNGKNKVGRSFLSFTAVLEELKGLREDVNKVLELLGAVAMSIDVERQRRGE